LEVKGDEMIRNIFNGIVYFFEHGDLVPLIVIVSAVHYAAILSHHDHIIVAVAIGLLVDLGHYRWVRAAVRYHGNSRQEKFARWSLALLMTVVSVAYQQRYYTDWWLSLPLPTLIFSLAWLGAVDKRKSERKEAEYQPVIKEMSEVLSAGNKAPSLPEPLSIWKCEDCPRTFATQNGLNAHQRAHKAELAEWERRNGHKVKV
jgi:hypothetical protein